LPENVCMKNYINCPNITRCLPEKYFFSRTGRGGTALPALASYADDDITCYRCGNCSTPVCLEETLSKELYYNAVKLQKVLSPLCRYGDVESNLPKFPTKTQTACEKKTNRSLKEVYRPLSLRQSPYPPNTSIPRPTQFTTPNGIQTQSAVFPNSPIGPTDIQTDRQTG